MRILALQRNAITWSVLALAIAIQCSELHGQESEGKDRLAEFVLRAAERSTQYSAIARFVDTGEVTPGKSSTPYETIVRSTFSQYGRLTRVDRASRYVTQDSWVKEFDLFTPSTHYEAIGTTTGGREFIQISKFQAEEKNAWTIFPFITCELPMTVAGGAGFEYRKDEFAYIMEGRVLHEGVAEDGGYGILVILMNRSQNIATRITFMDEPRWAVRSIEYFSAPQEGIDPLTVQAGDVEHWYRYILTRTEWERKDNEWYPVRLFMNQRQREVKKYTRDVEIEILEWKLGKNVDLTLLEPDRYTENSLREVPFEEWRKKFEERATKRQREAGRK